MPRLPSVADRMYWAIETAPSETLEVFSPHPLCRAPDDALWPYEEPTAGPDEGEILLRNRGEFFELQRLFAAYPFLALDGLRALQHSTLVHELQHVRANAFAGAKYHRVGAQILKSCGQDGRVRVWVDSMFAMAFRCEGTPKLAVAAAALAPLDDGGPSKADLVFAARIGYPGGVAEVAERATEWNERVRLTGGPRIHVPGQLLPRTAFGSEG